LIACGKCRCSVGQVEQDGIQQPGRPELQLERVIGTAPQIGQAEQSFDQGVGVFNAPALPRYAQGDDVGGGQGRHVQFIGQVAIPLAAIAHLDQAQRLRAVPAAHRHLPIAYARAGHPFVGHRKGHAAGAPWPA